MGNATNAEKARRTKAKRRDANKRKSRAGTLGNVRKASQRQKCPVCLTTMSPGAKLSVVCGHEFHRRLFPRAASQRGGRRRRLTKTCNSCPQNQTKQPNVHSLEEAEEKCFRSLQRMFPAYLTHSICPRIFV
uniref:Uncharacterized protein n=1 Tax=Globodera rostochiensis TaxID=31243 RepID=A0A914IDC4_GLORO